MSAAHDYGEIKNTFNILNGSMDKLRPPKLKEFVGDSFTTAELAKKVRRTRAAMYKEETHLPKDFIEQYLVPIVIASDLAVDLFQGDLEEARRWVLTPNSYFFGKSPFNVCLLGDGKFIIDFLVERLGVNTDGQEKKDQKKGVITK